jgi:hypothetical protein
LQEKYLRFRAGNTAPIWYKKRNYKFSSLKVPRLEARQRKENLPKARNGCDLKVVRQEKDEPAPTKQLTWIFCVK